jgi:hypothetical protein
LQLHRLLCLPLYLNLLAASFRTESSRLPQLLLQLLSQLFLLPSLLLLYLPFSLNPLAASSRTENSQLPLIRCSLTLVQPDLTMS